MGLVVICGLILRLYRDEFTAVAGSARFRIATFIQVTGQRAAVLLGAGFVVLVALLLSQSRGGILSTGLGLFVFVVLSLKTRKQGSPERREAVIVLGALLGGNCVSRIWRSCCWPDDAAGPLRQRPYRGLYDYAADRFLILHCSDMDTGLLPTFSQCFGINRWAPMKNGQWRTTPIWKYFKG